jgi:hypothetical protein
MDRSTSKSQHTLALEGPSKKHPISLPYPSPRSDGRWLWRGGSTRSHPELGSENPLRGWYCRGHPVGEYGAAGLRRETPVPSSRSGRAFRVPPNPTRAPPAGPRGQSPSQRPERAAWGDVRREPTSISAFSPRRRDAARVLYPRAGQCRFPHARGHPRTRRRTTPGEPFR